MSDNFVYGGKKCPPSGKDEANLRIEHEVVEGSAPAIHEGKLIGGTALYSTER